MGKANQWSRAAFIVLRFMKQDAPPRKTYILP
jgi:hypothetical protein